MTTWQRRTLGFLTGVALVAATAETTRGYATLGSTWAAGPITMLMQLAGGSGLSDGSSSFNASATAALSTWNQSLSRSTFTAINSTSGHGDGDLLNQVFFDSSYYGTSFGTDTLAITTRWTLDRTQRVEADVVFNTRFTWDSYRGNRRSAWDIRRVALHEFGHALGLDHPDERGQSVSALMNSILGNLDALTADDIAGAQSLYGSGVAGNVNFPPRNEPNAFYTSLLGVYQNELRARAVLDVCGSGRYRDLVDRIRAPACRPVQPRHRNLQHPESDHQQRRHAGLREHAGRRHPIPAAQ